MLAGERFVAGLDTDFTTLHSEKHKYETYLCKRAQLRARLAQAQQNGWDTRNYLNHHDVTRKLESGHALRPKESVIAL